MSNQSAVQLECDGQPRMVIFRIEGAGGIAAGGPLGLHPVERIRVLRNSDGSLAIVIDLAREEPDAVLRRLDH